MPGEGSPQRLSTAVPCTCRRPCRSPGFSRDLPGRGRAGGAGKEVPLRCFSGVRRTLTSETATPPCVYVLDRSAFGFLGSRPTEVPPEFIFTAHVTGGQYDVKLQEQLLGGVTPTPLVANCSGPLVQLPVNISSRAGPSTTRVRTVGAHLCTDFFSEHPYVSDPRLGVCECRGLTVCTGLCHFL